MNSVSRENNGQRNGPESKKLLDATPLTPPSSPTTPQFRDLDEIFRQLPITEDTSCGIWCLRGPCLQKFANKKAYVFLYGVLGCIFSASYAYFNGTITTIEKRFKIPSKTTGIITVGNDISQLLVSVVLSYYAGKGHRPRWIAVGIYTVVLFCCLTMLPHFLYGPGEDALLLTKEYGPSLELGATNATSFTPEKQRKFLCKNRTSASHCIEADGNFAPQVLLFVAQLVSGIGGSLYYTLGVSYMDDNIQKSKTPALISFSYFLRMLGPALGYGLASFALKFYISPTLTPTITMHDPRWLGAWWLGWIILAILLFVFASVVALFPKTLPRAAARKVLAQERNKSASNLKAAANQQEQELPASVGDMLRTFKRLLTNTTLMCNNLAAVFYLMGYMPYWIFMPKYIETQYKQSASVSSLITGTVGLVFSAFGILLSGLVISKYKPKARYLAAWNVMVGAISVLGMISYAFLSCPANDKQIAVAEDGSLETLLPCNQHCHCDYVTYNPVCSELGRTFISACHAGCTTIKAGEATSKIYSECSCIKPSLALNGTSSGDFWSPRDFGTAVPGACPIDCVDKFYIFLAVVCVLKFVGATGRASNFLVSVRCVDEKDKTVAMGFGLTIMSLFAFIPSPILFGYILDKTCLVWGKTCSGTGNCWLYNGETLRYLLNFTAASFVTVGTVFDVGVWYYVKDVKIFDEEVELENIAEEPGDL
ncbi:solute carrier organic anion transporter family member 2A1-like [Copidosoma floridanum]|uniref:solute carrier organic anion transporter family member 2A1-like n=1 Tax=Copidosoma floridanum TaxID=29053 RepID=UPI0006C9DD85|nr:solute carrier organic anion transporter family member 2A1-like [Copidosoma floridanum]XP_014214472.1 solute carrier organic anion transporter family member 2A1-like [Copidosoma floridanum]XP_014214473.1 solute carrier organic anion transporter family member 2A1-like [Copidosoma floridanum]XP_014214474.1 solute carrier organic anion transporter family member 2A1-like [Copidosoma floridanum]XP_014214475.1 solute carrier organic anion transporter family member 2A1-like [Copidosoma floridanum]